MTAQPSNLDNDPRHIPGAEMLTIKEAAHFLRVPENTLRYWRPLGSGRGASRSAATSDTGAPTSFSGSPSRRTVHSTTEPARLCPGAGAS
jgi:hypothetical protein